jgi:hypothetical protein
MERIVNVAYSIIVAVVVLMIATIPDGLPYALGTAFVLLVLREVLFLHMRRMRRITEMRNRTKNIYVVGSHPYRKEEITIFQDYPGLLTVVPHEFVAQTVKALKSELSEVGNRNGLPNDKGERGPVKVLRFIMGEGDRAGETWLEYMAHCEAEIRKDMANKSSTEKKINEDWELEYLNGQNLTGSFEWDGKYTGMNKKERL